MIKRCYMPYIYTQQQKDQMASSKKARFALNKVDDLILKSLSDDEVDVKRLSQLYNLRDQVSSYLNPQKSEKSKLSRFT